MQIRCTQADHQNQYITGFCIDTRCQNQRPYCHFCLPCHGQHLNKLTSQELLSEWIKERVLSVQNIQSNVQECKIALDSLLNLFLLYNNFNISQFPELGLQQIDQLLKGFGQIENCEEKLLKPLKQSIEQIILIVKEIQQNVCKNDNLQIQHFNRNKQILEQPQNQNLLKPNLNPFTFDLINQNSITQNQLCFAIAFNKDYSIVAAGCQKDIQVFQLIQGELNYIQLLSEHTNNVNTLNFMKSTNNFVSGSDDHSIIIWLNIERNWWICQQKLYGHENFILCLLLNNKDDLIISGSYDKTIRFWRKQDIWLCQQKISDHNNQVYSLSLNEQQNKLISCSHDSQILVMEKENLNNKWSVTQKIQVDQFGIRLCFINDNQFTFTPYCKEQLYIYEKEENTKSYRKTKEFSVKCGSNEDCCFFPQQYIQSKQILMNKNAKNINLLKKKENGDFIVQLSIEFGTCGIFGQLSDDGEYLITWDYGSKEIQIRKCREL
ncbi:unnamed protein product [Paramecium octaurelia]|uniref:WD40-repeat-containing domain n=1 Tax=Paramecium octaurelia TaxID=43137 RepID=A0A8S1YN06_PAROT|nr:unnamed protein product [Paramecium octaurelia]